MANVTDLVSLQRLVDQLNGIESCELRQATCFSFVCSDRMCIGKETFSVERKCAPHVKSWAIKYNPFLHHTIVIRGVLLPHMLMGGLYDGSVNVGRIERQTCSCCCGLWYIVLYRVTKHSLSVNTTGISQKYPYELILSSYRQLFRCSIPW